MERVKFSGVGNIIRFNWHYYVLSIAGVLLLVIAGELLDFQHAYLLHILAVAILLSIIVSLAVSAYIYDFSNLYTFHWLSREITTTKKIVNIHAGFDETSHILAKLYPDSTLTVLDFYDPVKHMEVSIERARKAYPSFPGTIKISTENLPFSANSVDVVFLTLAVHEIRNLEERTNFFKSLRNSLTPGGKIIVTEHLRDVNNFLAFNIGFLHFHSRNEWLRNFQEADLYVISESKITPFISIFILQSNGTSS